MGEGAREAQPAIHISTDHCSSQTGACLGTTSTKSEKDNQLSLFSAFENKLIFASEHTGCMNHLNEKYFAPETRTKPKF